MKLEEIQPFVRFAMRMRVAPTRSGKLCAARDCRLFRLEAGKASIWAKGMGDVEMTIGRCVYVPAGCPYRLTVDDENVFWIVNFDFDRKNASATLPLPMTDGEEIADAFAVPIPEDAPFFAEAFFADDCAMLHEAFSRMKEECAKPKLYSALLVSAHMSCILCALARSERGMQSAQNDAVQRMIDFVRERYAQPLTNAEIASFVNYHPNYANRLFEVRTGQTMRQYLIGVRIRRAVTLLLSTSLSVSEIAPQVGFSSLSLFSKQFARITGVSPSQYRKSAGV